MKKLHFEDKLVHVFFIIFYGYNLFQFINIAHTLPNKNTFAFWNGITHENVNISIYTIPNKAGMLEPHVVKYSHAYFPVGLFDEVNLDFINDGYVFGRKGDTYIMLCAMSDGDAKLSFKKAFSQRNRFPSHPPQSKIQNLQNATPVFHSCKY